MTDRHLVDELSLLSAAYRIRTLNTSIARSAELEIALQDRATDFGWIYAGSTRPLELDQRELVVMTHPLHLDHRELAAMKQFVSDLLQSRCSYAQAEISAILARYQQLEPGPSGEAAGLPPKRSSRRTVDIPQHDWPGPS